MSKALGLLLHFIKDSLKFLRNLWRKSSNHSFVLKVSMNSFELLSLTWLGQETVFQKIKDAFVKVLREIWNETRPKELLIVLITTKVFFIIFVLNALLVSERHILKENSEKYDSQLEYV